MLKFFDKNQQIAEVEFDTKKPEADCFKESSAALEKMAEIARRSEDKDQTGLMSRLNNAESLVAMLAILNSEEKLRKTDFNPVPAYQETAMKALYYMRSFVSAEAGFHYYLLQLKQDLIDYMGKHVSLQMIRIE